MHKLLQQAEAKRQEASQIIDGAGDDGLTAEQLEQVEALTAEADGLEDQHARLERAAALKRENENRIAAYDRGPGPRTQPDPISGRAEVVREGFEDDPQAGFKTPREFMAKVMDAGMGKKADPRLKPLMATVGSDEAGTYSDGYGGVLVPDGFSPMLLTVPTEADPVAGMVRRIPMASPKVDMPVRVDKDHSTSVSGGLRVYRRSETEDVTASRMQFEGVELAVKDLMGLSYATEAILTDSAISFAALIADGFADEFRSKIMDERINGLGGGQFAGVLNAACKVRVSKETGQVAATIVFENVTKMLARAWRPQMWLANRTIIPQLAKLTVDVGTGGAPIFLMNAQGPFPGTLMGLPIAFTEHCSALGTEGDLILCNWREYLEGTLGGTESAESIHVRFIYRERAFRFYMRNDGRPWWSSALTPRKGDTLSPFVTLQTRS